MDKFELYMVETMKMWSDKVVNNVGTDNYNMCLNVFEELSSVYVSYKNINDGIDVMPYLQGRIEDSKIA